MTNALVVFSGKSKHLNGNYPQYKTHKKKKQFMEN